MSSSRSSRTGNSRTGTSRIGITSSSRVGTSRVGNSRPGTSRAGTSRPGISRPGTNRTGSNKRGTADWGTAVYGTSSSQPIVTSAETLAAILTIGVKQQQPQILLPVSATLTKEQIAMICILKLVDNDGDSMVLCYCDSIGSDNGIAFGWISLNSLSNSSSTLPITQSKYSSSTHNTTDR